MSRALGLPFAVAAQRRGRAGGGRPQIKSEGAGRRQSDSDAEREGRRSEPVPSRLAMEDFFPLGRAARRSTRWGAIGDARLRELGTARAGRLRGRGDAPGDKAGLVWD